MERRRSIGIGLTALGFAVAVIAGLLLAARFSVAEPDVGQILLLAGLAFIPIAILMGSGLYLYLKSAPPELSEAESLVLKQRQMMDIARSHGQISLLDLAIELNISVREVRELIEELTRLEIFDGYVDWESGIIFVTDAGRLLDAP